MDTTFKIDEGRICAFNGDQEEGRLEFSVQNQVMNIEHTYAYEKGKGTGRKLVMEAVDFAKENHLKIKPTCSYAHALLTRTDEYRDLLVDNPDEGVSCSL